MASTPLVACSMSNLLKIRKINIFGKTQRVIECVIISDSFSLRRYVPSDISPAEKRNIVKPMIKGSMNPLIRPVITLSYFSDKVIS
jgi:hypothetical protein